MAQIIVVGNEKGGSGKTTTAMHLIVSLLQLGFSVASLDLDVRQMSLTRYLQNRQSSASIHGIDLELPEHFVLASSKNQVVAEMEAEEEKNFVNQLELLNHKDFIVVDTPGSNSFLNKLAHSYADMVITPINDSFIDLDLIGQIHLGAEKEKIVPGVYSAMLWEQKMQRLSRNRQETSWVVVRNRLSALDAKNKRSVEEALEVLAKKFGFRIIPGFGDRVIFKELFLQGLTLHDAKKTDLVRMSPSVLAARHELLNFMIALKLDDVNSRLKNII
jgi:chromosome partitioning protein